MENRAMELFRVSVSRSATNTSLAASAVAQSSFRVTSASPGSSPLALGLEAEENSAERMPSPGLRGAALLQEAEQQPKQQPRQQLGEPFARTTLTSPALSLRADSPSFVRSLLQSPPRVRPTSELLPTRAAMDVPRSAPMFVHAEEDVPHAAHACLSESTAQPQSSVASPKLGNPTHGDSTTFNVPGSVPSAATVRSEEKAARSTTCHVCPLCGISVVLVGTFVEHQLQWNEHVASWMHQRNLQLRAAAQRKGRGPVESATWALTPPLSSGLLHTTGDISASPVLLQPEDTSPGAISLLRAMAFPTRAEGVKAEAFAPSPEHAGRETVSFITSPPHVHKKLFVAGNSASASENNNSGEEHMEGCHTEDAPAPFWTEGNPRRKALPREMSSGAPPPAEQRSGGAPSNDGSSSRAAAAQEADHVASSEVSESASLREELARRKERQLERTLAAFLMKREGQQLLDCFRRWFNLMFVRTVNGSSLLHGSPPTRGPAANAAAASDSAGIRSGKEVSLLGCNAAEEQREETSARATSSHPGHEPKWDKQTRDKRTTGDGGREGAFMASQFKDFAHVLGSSSSSSVEVEVAKTDVSWHIQRSVRQPHHGGEGDSDGASPSGSLESDTSIQEMLSSLTPRLQERVRTVLRGEPRRSRAFPKTSKALSSMRCSLPVQVPSPTGPSLLVSGGDSRGAPSSPTAQAAQSGLEDVMQGRSESRLGASSLSSTRTGPCQRCGAEGDIKLESYLTQGLHTATEVDEAGMQGIPAAMGVATRNVSPPPAEPAAVPWLRQGDPLGRSSGDTVSAGVRDSPLRSHSRSSLEGHPKSPSKREALASSPSRRRDWPAQGAEETADLAARESCAPQPFLLHQRRSGRRSSRSSSRPQARREEALLRRGRAEETFRGIPGEYYCYYNAAYHRVLDPTAEVYYDARGRRLPFFVVRRSSSATTSPTRWPTATTHPQSPLGPGRLNPYCSVCVGRYCLVLVDEHMQPVAVPPSRQRGAFGNGDEAHGAVCPGRSARSPTPRGARNPLLPRTPRPLPRRTVSRGRQDSPASSQLASRCAPATGNNFAAATVSEHASVRPNPASDAPLSGSGARDETQQESVPEEAKWLRRQERRLRRRVKSLLWRELPQCRGSQQWVEYLTSLKETIKILEALRSGADVH
ncbi:megakaryocyte stimulating factor [Trypanosoma conorhini]|uniref:Megakaryocyte stimulating factor n=1 Tax=Trypanosoma conorhini TaxID=83891 RepID=A0A3R7PIS7_9TRYP|nr:megakaryocyte stimulating factor [Trypanosoma conorhini]RNF20581.1 megakaryocyte stimulating factor [Trypanosoma conorhini]